MKFDEEMILENENEVSGLKILILLMKSEEFCELLKLPQEIVNENFQSFSNVFHLKKN
jgi:hypothetical protein